MAVLKSSIIASCAVDEQQTLVAVPATRTVSDYYAHSPHTAAALERLAREEPQVLACMHGSAWRGKAGALLRELSRRLSANPLAAAA